MFTRSMSHNQRSTKKRGEEGPGDLGGTKALPDPTDMRNREILEGMSVGMGKLRIKKQTAQRIVRRY